jgi:hypothetical protein
MWRLVVHPRLVSSYTQYVRPTHEDDDVEGATYVLPSEEMMVMLLRGERGTGWGVGDDDGWINRTRRHRRATWHQTSTYVLIIWTFLCLNRILPQISMENLILIQIQMYLRTYFLRTYFETGRILFPPTFNTCRRFNELRHILACILTKSAISIIGLNK